MHLSAGMRARAWRTCLSYSIYTSTTTHRTRSTPKRSFGKRRAVEDAPWDGEGAAWDDTMRQHTEHEPHQRSPRKTRRTRSCKDGTSDCKRIYRLRRLRRHWLVPMKRFRHHLPVRILWILRPTDLLWHATRSRRLGTRRPSGRTSTLAWGGYCRHDLPADTLHVAHVTVCSNPSRTFSFRRLGPACGRMCGSWCVRAALPSGHNLLQHLRRCGNAGNTNTAPLHHPMVADPKQGGNRVVASLHAVS